jgi:hypothetical protein
MSTGVTRPEQSDWTESQQFARIELVEESFAAATTASGTVQSRDFVIAGYRVRVRAATSGLLARLSRALAHLEAAVSAEPQLTINLWDSGTGETPAPPTPAVEGEQAPGAFFYYSDDRLRAGYQLGTSGDARVLSSYPEAPTPALSVLDMERNAAWYWVEDAARIPYWEEATPVRYILDWWLRDRGVHQLHAGAVGTPEGGVLLVGKSGSGKSTSTLATLSSDLRYAGDDYVAVSQGDVPEVHSLYSSGKLMSDHVQRLPFLLPTLDNASRLDEEKAVVFINERWPSNISTGFPLRAILAPRVVPGAERAQVREVSPAMGLAALAPSTVFQMHTRGQDSLARMRRLVECVPSFTLELGSDMASIPRAIADLLERLTPSG